MDIPLATKDDDDDVFADENGAKKETVVTLQTETAKAEDTERQGWGGKLEFVFTCIGYAVGLGNVWRFPYLCYKNGGGAFLIPYVTMLALVGLPLFFMELSLGQFASLGPITVWKLNPLMKGLGYAMVLVSWLIAVYYNVVIAHIMMYLFETIVAIFKGIKWTSCDNWWNTEYCISPIELDELRRNATAGNVTYDVINNSTKNTSHALMRTATEEFYNNYVLEMSGGIDQTGTVSWKLVLCLMLCWFIVLVCLIRGVQSLGKVVYFTAIFPYLMLTILLIRGATLPGAMEGVKFYLTPDFSRLLDARVWADAATQIFYSLGACNGGLIAMSSYNKFNNNCYQDSLVVALVNCCTSIYSGFVIFSILGFMAQEKGVSVAEVATGGPGLAFVVYPEALSRMPVPVLWSFFFFFMMATLGFGSQFTLTESVLSGFTDEFFHVLKAKRASIIFRTIVIIGTFLLGIPMVTQGGIYLLNLIDYSVSGFPLLFVAFAEMVSLSWIYGFRRFSKDIKMMLGFKPNIYWKATWVVVSPISILAIIFANCIFFKPPSLDGYKYPYAYQVMGWLIALFPILLMPAFFLVNFCKARGFEVLKEAMQPAEDWGPALHLNRKERYAMRRQSSERGTRDEGTLTYTPPVDGMEFLFPQNLNRTVQLFSQSTQCLQRTMSLPSTHDLPLNSSPSGELIRSAVPDITVVPPSDTPELKRNART